MSQPTTLPAQIVADTIIRTVELGVRISDAAVAGEITVLWCELLVEEPGRCPGCGIAGTYRDHVERRVSDVPVVGHPLELRVRVPRYECRHDGCARAVFAHDTSRLARPGASTTRRCARFILRRLMLDKATVAAVARELGRSWDTVNDIAVAATTTLLLTAGPARLKGVQVIGVDEHKWAHVRSAEADGRCCAGPTGSMNSMATSGAGRSRTAGICPAASNVTYSAPASTSCASPRS